MVAPLKVVQRAVRRAVTSDDQIDVIRNCHLKLALAQLRCLEFQYGMVCEEPGEALLASICDALSLSVLSFHQQQLASVRYQYYIYDTNSSYMPQIARWCS